MANYVDCRSCSGLGKKFVTRNGRYGAYTKEFPCRACGGTGINQNLYSTNCAKCGVQIVYPRSAQYPPKYCKSCKEAVRREKERKATQWKTKSCKTCGAEIKYNITWSHIPDICKTCKDREKAMWQEKPCKKCGGKIRYRVDWTNVPDYCKTCKDDQKRRLGQVTLQADRFRRLALEMAMAQRGRNKWTEGDCEFRVKSGWSRKYEKPTTDILIFIKGVHGHYHAVIDEDGVFCVSEWH